MAEREKQTRSRVALRAVHDAPVGLPPGRALRALLTALFAIAASLLRPTSVHPSQSGTATRIGPSAVLAEARELRERGEGARAEGLVRGALPQLVGADGAEAHALLGRLALARGEPSPARDELTRAIDLALAVQAYQVAADATVPLVYLELEVAHDTARARAALARVDALPGLPPMTSLRLRYMQGVLAFDSRDPRAALRALAEVRDGLRAASGDVLYRDATHMMARTLSDAGRHREASALLDELLAAPSGASPCELTDFVTSRGWNGWLALQGPRLSGPERERRLAEVARDFASASRDAERCGQPWQRRNAALNEGLIALEQGDPTRAEQALARAQAIAEPDTMLRAWELDLEARIAAARGDLGAARRAFEAARALGHESGQPELVFRALSGLGQLALRAGALGEAEQSFAGADELVERLALSVPLSTSLSAFFADRDASARGLLSVRLARGEIAKAERMARRFLARGLSLSRCQAAPAQLGDGARAALRRYHELRARLDESARSSWQLSGERLSALKREQSAWLAQLDMALDELHAPARACAAHPEPSAEAPGTLALTLHPLERGWVAFAELHGQVRVQRFDMPPSARDALAPFSAELARAQRVALRVHPVLEGLELHAVAGLPATYVHDLGPGAAQAAAANALVVADPDGTLPRARAEGAAVHGALSALGFDRPALLAGPEASREALRQALRGVSWLHYAGHGRAARERPLDARLALAGGASLELADLYALPEVPATVFLSACDAGRSAEEFGAVSLAHGFLERGARQVVAPTRPVDDEHAARLVQRVYEHLVAGGPNVRLSEALHAAQQALALAHPEGDWWSYRVWTRQ